MKRSLLLMFVMVFANSALAEHDRTYCGKLLPGSATNARAEDQPLAVLEVTYYELVGFDDYEEATAYAALHSGDARAVKKISKFLKNAKPNTIFCAKGRWAGSLYSSLDIEDIQLRSDAVERFDYASSSEK